MSSEPEQDQQVSVFTLEGDDGNSYTCQILDIFDFDNQQYALVINSEDDVQERLDEESEEEDETAIVVMRYQIRDEQHIFQTIETQEEFDRVVAYVEQKYQQDEEGEDEEGEDEDEAGDEEGEEA